MVTLDGRADWNEKTSRRLRLFPSGSWGEAKVHEEYKTWEKRFQDGDLGNDYQYFSLPRSCGGECTVRAYSCNKVSNV